MINISRVEEIDFLKDSRILRQSSWSSFFLQMLPPPYCVVSSVSLCSPSPAVVMKRIYILVVSSHDRELVFLICQIFLLRLRADFEEARVNYKFSISRTIVSLQIIFPTHLVLHFPDFYNFRYGLKTETVSAADSGLIQTVFQLTFWAWKQENWVLRYHRICLTFSKR